MKTHEINDFAGTPGTGISLRKLISRLVSSVSHAAAVNRVYILNEVSAEFRIPDEQVKIISVIKELLTTMSSNARNTCISVTAEKFTDIIILNFEDQNNYNGYALSFSLMAIEQHARIAGGDISIDGAQKKVATVSFSFPDASFRGNQVYCS
ncbi:MAG: hypothetical protein ABI675_06785 [Chitinophagaceae bacterium]